MPFTPYHFGPSGTISLAFRRWLDVPIFILANVAVDIEVLIIGIFDLGNPMHRYSHTFLGGAIVGLLLVTVAYPFRNYFKKLMGLFSLPYESSFKKMAVSGILGVWLHVLIDGAYHFDVKMFWPNKTISLWRALQPHITKNHIKDLCVVFWLVAVGIYVIDRWLSSRAKKKGWPFKRQPCSLPIYVL